VLVKKIIFLIFSLFLIGSIVFFLLKGYGEKYGLLTLAFIISGLLCLNAGLFRTKDLDKGKRSGLIVHLFGMEGAFRFYIYSGIFYIILGIIYFFVK
jgi:hypothetical protein